MPLMTSAEFNQYRRDSRAALIQELTPTLEKERAALWKQYQTARRAIRNARDMHVRKSLEEALYADDGIARKWAQVDATLSTFS